MSELPTLCDKCNLPYYLFSVSGICPGCGDKPGTDRNRRLKIDAITCLTCDFARAIPWGTHETPAPFVEAFSSHLLDNPDHHVTFPSDFKPGMQPLSDLERRSGAAYMKGRQHGVLQVRDQLMQFISEKLK